MSSSCGFVMVGLLWLWALTPASALGVKVAFRICSLIFVSTSKQVLVILFHFSNIEEKEKDC